MHCIEEERRKKEEIALNKTLLDLALKNSKDLVSSSSILKDMGDSDILKDAFEDGSSVICVRCNSLVKRTRWEVHSTKWCPFIKSTSNDDDDDDDMDVE